MKIKRLKFYYRMILVICIGFLIAGISVTVYMAKKDKAENISYFKEAVANRADTISRMVNSNIETLDGVAITIGEMEVVDLEHLLPVLREINDRNTFFRMGFIHEDGCGDMVDLDGTIHREVNFTNESFYQKAMKGEESVSTTLLDELSGQYLNYYGVPVVMQGETVGVLAAADRTDRLRTLLDAALFSGGGHLNVIDENGQYVIRSSRSAEVENIRDIGDFSELEAAAIQKGLKNRTAQLFEFESDGAKSWAAYQPLEIGSWMLLGIVREDHANNDFTSVMGVVFLITVAMIIFSFLAYGMNRMQMKSERRLEELAYKDPLLHTDNFVKFSMDAEEKLKMAVSGKTAFWYGDIDDFKIFNEMNGYEAGDRLLKDMAEMLQKLSRPDELFCREMADHFVGIRHYEDQAELSVWYGELSKALEHYSTLENKYTRLVMSMGFYCAETPGELLTVNEMYNRARMAQKSIKQEKNVKYSFYSDRIRRQILRENEIEARMQEALERNCFKVYIQPKTEILKENRVIGGEALVRWEDPEWGMVSPGDFIPLFEKNGFIIPLDRYMFEAVCTWLEAYLASGGRPIHLAVNVSRLGIFQDDFIEYYTSRKKAHHIPDGMLELEFTESLALEDNDFLRRRALELKKEGFSCSLDDFGAGYSSLNTLKDLPIDVLKLDMVFFKKGTDTAKAKVIVENVVHLAKQLDIRVVAEGVEEVEQVEFLRNCRCDIVQGFVFERPIPAESFRKLLERDPKGNWGDGYQKNK